MIAPEVEEYRKQLTLYRNEVLEELVEELQGHIEFINKELEQRKSNG
jgi:hypothetical protein